MKILLAIDGSPCTKHMLAYIAAHEELLGARHEYVLFHVVVPVPPYAANFLASDTLGDYYRVQASQVLEPVQAFAMQHGWRTKPSHAHGHAAEAIVQAAVEEEADLIIMGSHGHTALTNVVLGSVATGVLARSKMPVLLVP